MTRFKRCAHHFSISSIHSTPNTHDFLRHLLNSIRLYPVSHQMPSPKYLSISPNAGEIERGSTTEAAWSSISSVGCTYVLTKIQKKKKKKEKTTTFEPTPVYRFCLEHLGVLLETDHKAIVLKVFWRYGHWAHRCCSHQTSSKSRPTQIYRNNAYPSVDILAGARRLSWSVGSGRLSLPALPLRLCPTTRA